MISDTKCSGFAALTNKNPCALAHGQSQISPLKNPWQALRAATEKAAREGDSVAEKSNLERFFAFARTHFSKNQQIRTDLKWKPSDNLKQNKLSDAA